MPPKRKAPAGGKAGGKKAKKADSAAADSDLQTAIKALKSTGSGKRKNIKVDKLCPIAGNVDVWEEYDCMLNQTNIGHNNNKYYVIQVLKTKVGNNFYAWIRWGRVGESGQDMLKGPLDEKSAVADFCKKFRDKTKNAWENRASFTPHPGKYTLLEMDDDESDDEAMEETKKKLAALDEADMGAAPSPILPCKLDKPTQDLMKLIFDTDMFNHAMKEMELDVKKMPLGKLSKSQIAKGFEVLDEIEKAVQAGKKNKLPELSSKFFTLIPHDFGRQRPPVISTQELVRKKMDMLLVLADIELAQSMQKEKEKEKKPGKKALNEAKPHPLDVNYGLLNCDLELLDKKSKEYKLVEEYAMATKHWRKVTLQEVWKVNRHGEDTRFAEHKNLDNRKLLWHGTNVAVVAAILKGGLRIMPHSGGRVGKGIYFASENSKSAAYVRCSGNGTGIMFVNEVALGKEHFITKDNCQLTAAPKGFDCIIAKGRTEPDPKKDKTMEIEGRTITIPVGNPVPQDKYKDSYFSQSEYLVYKESQNRIRFLLKLKMY